MPGRVRVSRQLPGSRTGRLKGDAKPMHAAAAALTCGIHIETLRLIEFRHGVQIMARILGPRPASGIRRAIILHERDRDATLLFDGKDVLAIPPFRC